MLNGKEIIDINGKKYLFCGFSKAKIISRKNNSDLAYSQEIIVLGRMIPSLKNYAIMSLLGQNYASFLSLNENGELDTKSKFISKNKIGINIFSDVNVIGYMEDMESQINLWNTKLSLLTGNKRPDRTFYTTKEAYDILQKHLVIDTIRDRMVLKNFLLDFISLYQDTPYYEIVREKYKGYIDGVYGYDYKYDFRYVKNYAVYEKNEYFYFIENKTSCFICDAVPMTDYEAVFTKFALRSFSNNKKDSMKLKFGRL